MVSHLAEEASVEAEAEDVSKMRLSQMILLN